MVEHPRTVEQNAVLALAFNELLEAPQPVGIKVLAERLEKGAARSCGSWQRSLSAAGSAATPMAIWSEAAASRSSRPGTSLLPQGRRFTWCAYDTLGIFGALAVSGTIRSKTPLEQPVELKVVDGRPVAANDAVLFPQGQVLTLQKASERGTADWRDCCGDCAC